MSRIVRENILAPCGAVAPPNEYVYSLDGEDASLNDLFNVGDLIIYDPRTKRTVTPGVTAATVPKLAIAVACDPRRLGYPTRLKHVFGGYLDSCAMSNVTTEPGACGCNGVVDFYSDCTFQGTSYTVVIESRGDRTLETHLWNTWEKESFTVNLNNYACNSCENGIDCMEVMCALVNKMNTHKKKTSVKKTGAFLRRALKQQAKLRKWTAYVLFEKDCKYTITHHDTECDCCVNIDGIGGVSIDGNVTMFKNTTLANDPTKSPKGKQGRIVKLVNKALAKANVMGSAVLKQQIVGSGAPCCDFQIILNSCVDVVLVDGAGAPLKGECTNPFETVKKDPNCKGCSEGKPWTPTCGIRVVAHGQEVTCDCNNPVDNTLWYHREVRISVPKASDCWSRFLTRVVQKPLPPRNLGVQWRKRIMNAVNGGPGHNYDNWVIDHQGIYMTPRAGTAFTESYKGLECTDIFCSVIFQHGLNYHEKSVNGSKNCARGRSILLFGRKKTELFDAFKEIMDPWLCSLSCGVYGPLICSVDVDQIEPTNYTDTAGGVPDGSSNDALVLGGVADGVASGLVPGDLDKNGDGKPELGNLDKGN